MSEPQTTSDVMNDVFASLMGTDEEGTEESVVEEESGDAPGGEKGEEAGEVEGKAEEEAGETEEKGVSPGSFTAPKHWPETDRDMFATLPEESQEFLLRVHKGFEADYTRKSQAIADVRRALDPIRPLMKKFNISEAVAVNNLVGTYKELVDNPVAGVKKVMGAYNLDLDDLSTYWEDPDRFAEESGRKVASLEQRLEEQQTKQQEEAYKRYLDYINNWSKDKEFFGQVENEMAGFVSSARSRGEEISLEKLDELYDKACWSVPEVREKLLEQTKTEQFEGSVEERKKKAAKAKTAAKAIKPSATTEKIREPEPPKTTSEAMDRVWSELAETKGVA